MALRRRTVRRHAARLRSWQDRLRDPSLTLLLVMMICMVFVATPFAARGSQLARYGGEGLVLLFVLVVVLLSRRASSIVAILAGLAISGASFLAGPAWHPAAGVVLGRAGVVITFLALTRVVVRLVFGPGQVTSRRLQGAVVLYTTIGAIFASIFRLIWQLNPGAFSNVPLPTNGPSDVAAMLYFSFTTLTTVGYGDILPVDPFARSLATLEAMVGQLYLATAVARLVTLELDGRRHRSSPSEPDRGVEG